MKTVKNKMGRPRRYDLSPLPGYANPNLGLAVAFLRELAERVYDQIDDLPREALDFSPGETRISISRLVIHLAWAEASWVQRLTGVSIPLDLGSKLDAGRLDLFGEKPASLGGAAELIGVCRRVQEEFTTPALRGVEEIDAPQEKTGKRLNVRGIMHQLSWHWVYHSGQIGLLRLLWGSDYQWTSDHFLGPLHPAGSSTAQR